MADTDTTAPGRLYRVGKHWYVDTALLQGIARRIIVEPMQGGYQILAPAGLVRCTSANGLALPGQTGALYRCQGQKPEPDIGARLRKLAGALGADALGGEWEEWPTGALTPAPTGCAACSGTTPKTSACGCASCSATTPKSSACGCASCNATTPKASACGCASCQAGGPCPCGAAAHSHDAEPQSFLERLIVSETLGTVRPQLLTGGAIVLYPAQHGAPAWACGRYHECIASILRFPDVAATEWIAVTEFRQGKLAIRWGVVLDRQRTLMLGEILQMVARLADRAARTKSLTPAAPSKHTPGFGAWEMAIEMTRSNPPCTHCPYRLGTNLRCPVCRQFHRHPVAAVAQESAVLKVLGEQAELRTLPPSTLRTLAQAIATSNRTNPHEPLGDRFFVQLERDILLALQPLGLGTRETEAVIEIAELLPFDPQIAVGAAARQGGRMTAQAQVFAQLLPRWRASLPPEFPRPYFDDFVLRMRPTLEMLVGAWMARRKTGANAAPESWTKGARTKRNLEAMRIVATRRPQDMTAEERRLVLGYSGWGGLSIEEVADQFPPNLVPSEFALIHEYYTPTVVAEAIADLVCPLLPGLAGFDGVVRAFEPSVGIGRLVRAMGPPRCLVTDARYKETRWTAVELSEVSARMFAAMRPDVELYASSLEQWMSEHAARYQGTLGLVLANPPYGQRGEFALQDKHPDYQERAAYAYFMRRCLDLLVPRGLGVFVIPSGFLTGPQHRKLRERVLLRHHLEVAFRLPSETTTGKDLFPGAHNVVDVLVWRARGGELKQVDPGDEFILDGSYFKEHPAHILGTEGEAADKTDKGPGKKRLRYHVIGDFTGFPAFTPRPVCQSCAIQSLPTFEATPVTTVTRDLTDEPDDTSSDLRQALDLGRRVDRYLALVAAEDPRALGLWPELTEALRNLQHTPALRAHGGNPWRWPELRALAERRALAQRLLGAYQKTGELAPGLAHAPNIQPKFRAQPGDVLAQAEHLYRSRRHLNIGDLEAFHKEQGGTLDRADMLAPLLAAEWNLDGDDWDELLPSRAYLGGILWPKHDRAAARAATDPQAAAQLRRLEGVMNLAVFEDIRDISPRQGWVPPALVSAWLTDTLNRRYGAVALTREGGTIQPSGSTYERLGGSTPLSPETMWCIGWMNHDFTIFKPKLSDAEIQKLAEEDAAATGQTTPEREKEDDDSEDEDAALGTVRLLLGRHWDRGFVAWVNAQEDRRTAVRDGYNRAFRGVVIPTYDGDVLSIARWTENGPQLKPHQIAGARRVLDLRRGLIAFDVGVGKTYTAIAVVAAAREEGWVRRPVVLVPSSLVWKWHDDFLCVLQDYRVLVIGSNRKRLSRGKRKGLITSESDTPEERAEKWSAFQAGLYDVVILSYDALGRTKMNQEALLDYVNTIEGLQRQIKLRQRNAAKKGADKLSERERAILKHGARAFVEEQLELPEGHKFDPGIAWDDIGIDMLVVDEAAAFKNSYKPEAREFGMPKFMGSGGDGSKRAWQLDFRASAVRKRTGGSGVVLLTATPAKNSPLEFYNLIQLIDPYAFSTKGLTDPEQFIDRFLRIESREIIDMTLKVSMRSVVDGFKNLDDFRMIVKTFGEFRTGAEVNLTLPEPRIEQVRVPLGPEQEDRYSELVRKLERALQQSQLQGSSQNKILGYLARLSLIALHPQLDGGVEYGAALSSVDPADYAAPKLTACAERIAASPGCGHIIFCEPTAVHLWMREVLVARGVPRERIAILNAVETQSADRIRIAREFNGILAEPPAPGACANASTQRVPPKYDVIIANSVAYEGIDLQVRTCAIHHLDLPWTPADLEQRNGRAVRQGNELPVVLIFYYLSDRSMDWYRYTLIQGKRAWLGDVLASQARDTSNPGAQQALSDEEILMMISRDPEATQRALEARREVLRAEARKKVAHEAANLLVQASARFRDARECTDAEKAARLRAEGDERLRDLRRVDVMAWPWARWAERAREVEVLVPSATSAPVFEGLRVGRSKAGQVMHMEFGRVVQGDNTRRIGRRMHGFPVWELLGEEALRQLELQPAELEAGAHWPDEDEAELDNVLDSHISHVLGKKVATYDELEWLGASDVWLTRWWPRLEKRVRQGLARSTAEEKYPLVVGEALTLASGEALMNGELLAPNVAGWQRFLELAPGSALKFGELRDAGLSWWQRRIPRGLLAARDDAQPESAAHATVPEEAASAEEAAPTSMSTRPSHFPPGMSLA